MGAGWGGVPHKNSKYILLKMDIALIFSSSAWAGGRLGLKDQREMWAHGSKLEVIYVKLCSFIWCMNEFVSIITILQEQVLKSLHIIIKPFLF